MRTNGDWWASELKPSTSASIDRMGPTLKGINTHKDIELRSAVIEAALSRQTRP